MSEWKKVKMGEIAESCLGKMLDAAKNRGEYKPYLANLNVRWGSFDTDNLSLMKFEEDEDERYGIKYGDLIICEGGEPGRCAIWKEQVPDMKIQKALHRVRPKNGLVDNFYLFYWFLLAGKRNWIDQYCTGATIKHLPGQKLKEVVVDLPTKEVQHRIATILSRYDSLIENYQKQIKLLEEAAQRLYKEWFVDLRFPGHENTKIVDGVPEGWEKKRLVDLVDVQYGYAFDGKLFNSNGEGMPILRIRNIPDGITSDYTTEEAQDCYIVHNGDIVVGMDGIFHINSWSGGDAYLVQRACSFRTKVEEMKGFIFQAIQEPIKFFEKTLVGATVAHLGKKHIDSIELCVPKSMELYDLFSKQYEQRQNLLSQIRFLTEARDRLLPKLMSGEIEV